MVLFSHRFLRCFLAKKCVSRWAALHKNMLSSPFRIVSFGVFPVVCVCVAFCIGFYGVVAESRLFANASLDLHLSFSSVRGWAGDGGGDDVQRMRLVSSVSLVALLLKRCRLLCEALLPLLVASLLKRQPCKKPEVLKLSRQKLRN